MSINYDGPFEDTESNANFRAAKLTAEDMERRERILIMTYYADRLAEDAVKDAEILLAFIQGQYSSK